MLKRVGLVGASCRAMAASLVRSGFSVTAADLFADYDMGQLGEVTPLRKYPWSAPRWLRDADMDAWCYTGGMENYPRLVERMAKQKRLLGCMPETLHRVRDPFWLANMAIQHGCEFPETYRLHDPPYEPIHPKLSDQWLLKPHRSAGGLNIKSAIKLPKSAHRFFLQRKMPGVPMSAVVLSTKYGYQMVGSSRLQAGPEFGAPLPYLFAGAVSVASPPPTSLQALVAAIHAEAGMIGLWGIDYLQADKPVILEVNPRWTATMALHERMRETTFMPCHVQACLHGEVELGARSGDWSSGARVVYASRQIVFTWQLFQKMRDAFSVTEESFFSNPRVADIPMPETTIAQGSPVCTLYADGKTEAAVEASLRESRQQLEAILYAEEESSADR